MPASASSAANTQVSGKAPASELIDFHHPRAGTAHRRAILLVVTAALVIGAGSTALALVRPPAVVKGELAGFLALVVLLTIVVAVLVSRFPTKDMRGLFAEGGPRSMHMLLAQLFPASHALPPNLRPLAKGLLRHGKRGLSVRICRATQAAPVEPLAQHFEPIAIDESDAHFVEVEEGIDAAVVAPSTQPTNRQLDERDAIRKVRRNITLAGGWLMLLTFGFAAAVQAWVSWNRGRMSFGLPVSLLWVLTALFLMGSRRGAWTPYERWMLIPGGLLSLSRTPFAKKDTIHLFRREDSVLVVFHASRAMWSTFVTDESKTQTIETTAREAQLLLRAWLSPIPPPPLEQLGELIAT